MVWVMKKYVIFQQIKIEASLFKELKLQREVIKMPTYKQA